LPPARFHTDQNAVSRSGLQTVQSFTSLWDQNQDTGAFIVVRSLYEQALVSLKIKEPVDAGVGRTLAVIIEGG